MAVRPLLFSLLVLGCPGPAPLDDCPRGLVDARGSLSGGFAGGVGGGTGSSAPSPPLGMVGVELSLTTFAPLTSCVSDSVRADMEVLDPDLNRVPFSTTPGPTSRGMGVVSASLRFTPLRSGLHTVRVSFEPALGVRTVLVNVAGSGDERPFVRVPIGCAPQSAWPLAVDAVACEDNAGIEVRFADGGTSSFAGAQLVVADRVLWSVDGSRSVLERRLFTDGGLTLTHSFPSVSLVPTLGEHSETTAIRTATGGALGLFRVEGSGGDVVPFLIPTTQGLALWSEPGGTLWTSSYGGCGTAPCLTFPMLQALEPDVVWQRSEASNAASVEGFARPHVLRPQPVPRYTINSNYPIESFVLPTTGFERIPLWLTTDFGAGRRVLVSADRGALDFTGWPRTDVLRVGRTLMLLKDPEPGFVRVFQR